MSMLILSRETFWLISTSWAQSSWCKSFQSLVWTGETFYSCEGPPTPSNRAIIYEQRDHQSGLKFELNVFLQDVEIKEEGTRHILILYNVNMGMAGGVDFSAANAKSNAQLRVKGWFLSFYLVATSSLRNVRHPTESCRQPTSCRSILVSSDFI